MKKLSITLTKTETHLGFAYLAVELLVLPLLLVVVNWLLGQPMDNTMLNVCMFCINFVCILLIFHRFLWQSAKFSLKFPLYTLRAAGLGFLLYYLCTLVLSWVIFAIKPDFANANDASVMQMISENPLLMQIGTVFLVPVAEEVLYRGVVFGSLYNRNRLVAYLVSILAFAALHVIGYVGSVDALTLVLCFLQYLPAGLSLGWAYARADSIWAPILIHVTINYMSTVLLR